MFNRRLELGRIGEAQDAGDPLLQGSLDRPQSVLDGPAVECCTVVGQVEAIAGHHDSSPSGSGSGVRTTRSDWADVGERT